MSRHTQLIREGEPVALAWDDDDTIHQALLLAATDNDRKGGL